MESSNAINRLESKGLSITRPRVKILEYLMVNHTHPTIDKIYEDMIKVIPNISRTTVYNTVKTLKQSGLIQILFIDSNKVCVDENTSMHGHLLCRTCGRVVDVPIVGLKSRKMIGGNLVEDLHQYYIGVCKDCLKNYKRCKEMQGNE